MVARTLSRASGDRFLSSCFHPFRDSGRMVAYLLPLNTLTVSMVRDFEGVHISWNRDNSLSNYPVFPDGWREPRHFYYRMSW